MGGVLKESWRRRGDGEEGGRGGRGGQKEVYKKVGDIRMCCIYIII